MDSIQSAKVGVVTVTYNSGDVIDEFMTSLLAQDHQNYILYVVDNASSDNTLSKVSKYQDDRIVIISNKDNVGVAKGNNQGISASIIDGCSHVLLINNDTVFGNQLVTGLLLELENYQCDLIAPKIMYHDKPSMIWFAGAYFKPLAAYDARHYGIGQVDKGQYDTAKAVDFNTTCCNLIKVNVFNSIGMMDEKYFVYLDDVDFGYRTMKNGFISFYTPKVNMYHKVSSLTGGDDSDFTTYHLVKNRVYFIRKFLSLPFIIYGIFFCQSRYFAKFLMRRESWKRFKLRQSSFKEGFGVEVSR